MAKIILYSNGTSVGEYETSATDIILPEDASPSTYDSMAILEGGTATNTMVNSDGAMTVSSGGTAATATVNNGGSMTIDSGGTAATTTVNSGGLLYVSSGGTATGVDWTPTVGKVFAEDGATVGYTSTYTGIYFGSNNELLSTATMISNTTVGEAGELYVMNGGSATDIHVNSSGSMTVSSGGSAVYTNIDKDGTMNMKGGSASATVINAEGVVNIYSGTNMSRTSVYSGTLNIFGGNAITNTISGGNMTIFSAGSADLNTINGGMVAISGGNATNNTLNNGSMTIFGGSVSSNTVNGGEMSVFGGSVTDTTLNGGKMTLWRGNINSITLNGGEMSISGGFVSDTTLSGGTITILQSGIVSNTTLSGGEMTVSSGGVANSNTISGGTMTIASRGHASNVTVSAGGQLIIQEGGDALDITENGGYVDVLENTGSINFLSHTFTFTGSDSLTAAATVHSGTTALSNTVDEGGSLDVFSGGIADSNTINNGGAMTVFSGGSVTGNTLSGGTMTVSSAGHANSTTISGGELNISNGGIMENTTVSAGVINVYEGGNMSGVTANQGVQLTISAGGTATAIVENGGFVDVQESAAAEFVAHTFSDVAIIDTATVHSGTIAFSNTINAGGHLDIYDGGIASANKNYGGTLNVYFGGQANNNTIKDSLYVFSGGNASENEITGGDMYISSGGTATGNTVNNNGDIWVYDSATANSTIIGNAGYLQVSEGAIANDTMVNKGGHMYVSEGGTANSTTINGGYMWVYGTANSTTISGGSMEVVTAGTASATTITGGKMTVSGRANSTTITGGNMDVNGGEANSTTITSGNMTVQLNGNAANTKITNGSMTINNAAATTTTINGGGMIVDGNGRATDTAINNGSMTVSSGGTATTATISGGSMLIALEGSATSVTLQNGGHMEIMGSSSIISAGGSEVISGIGGWVSGVTVNQGGDLWVHNYGSAYGVQENGGFVTLGAKVSAESVFTSATLSGLTLTDSASVHCSTTASDTIVNEKGDLRIFAQGLANNTTINDGGFVYVNISGTATGNTVSAGGKLILSGGAATGNTVSAGGSMMIYGSPVFSGAAEYAAGKATDTTVCSGGALTVLYAGTANSVTLENGAVMDIYSGGTAGTESATDDGVTVSKGANLVLHNAAAAYNIVEDGGYVAVTSGTTATFTSHTFSGVTLTGNSATVHSGTTASGTVINALGTLEIFSGGIASSTTINSGGLMTVSSGGHAESGVTVNHGAELVISSGGFAYKVTENGGYVTIDPERSLSCVSHEFSSLTLEAEGSATSATVHAGTTATEIIINAGGKLDVFQGGKAKADTINSAGELNVYSGGLALSAVIESAGELNVYANGRASAAAVNAGGLLTVISGGTATEAAISGSAATSANKTSAIYGSMVVLSGGIANDAEVNACGSMTVDNGGIANSATVNSAGTMTAVNGGITSDTRINTGGSMLVVNGGSADAAQINAGGLMTISNTGIANSATVNSAGSMTVANGGITSDTRINTGGIMTVASGGAAFNVDWTPCVGTIIAEAGATITYASAYTGVYLGTHDQEPTSSATMSGMTVSASNEMFVMQSGTAEKTTVNSGGIMTVSSGGIAKTATVCTGGSMTVSSGGKVSGTLQIETGAVVSVTSGATIDFTVAEAEPESETALIQNWNLIQGKNDANYTITIKAEQDYGIYLLADNAADFSKERLSLKTEKTDLGLIAVGSTVIVGETSYSLNKDSGNLTLTVDSALPVITLEGDTETWLQQSTITASVTPEGSAIQYSLDQENWTKYTETITVTDNGTWYFKSTNDSGLTGTNQITFKNIDRIKPTITVEAVYSETEATVSATFEDHESGIKTQQYSINGGTPQDYTAPIQLASGDTVTFKAVDKAGNEQEESYTAGVIPVITLKGDTTTWLQQSTITASVTPEGSTLQYSLDQENWIDYTTTITVQENGTWYFKAENATGQTGTNQITFDHIDRIKPAITVEAQKEATYDIVSADLTDNESGIATRQYSINGGMLYDYTNTAPIQLASGDTVTFKAVDYAGNEQEKSYTATPATPVITLTGDTTTWLQQSTITATVSDQSQIQYSLDQKNWINYTGTITVTNNGIWYFKAENEAGKVGTNQITFNNIDRNPPAITVSAQKESTYDIVSAAFTDDLSGIATQQYRIDDGDWYIYTEPIVMTQNGTVYFRAVDNAGNETTDSYTTTGLTVKAPTMYDASVKKYDVSLYWSKVTMPDKTNVSYELIDENGTIIKLNKNQYKLKNVSVGTKTFQVRAVTMFDGSTRWSNEVTAEVIDVTAPKTGKITEFSQADQYSAYLSWNPATDNDQIAAYVVTCGDQSIIIWDADTTEYTFTGLAGEGKVTATVKAIDAAGNQGKTVKKNLTMQDKTPPTAATNLTGYADNKDGGTLTWTASTDNVDVTKYEIQIKNGKTYTSKTNSVNIKKLAAGTYSYTVVAYDKAKNASEVSEVGTFTSYDVIDPKIKKLKVTDIEIYPASDLQLGESLVGEVQLDWNATDETTPSSELKYQFQFDGQNKTVGADNCMTLASSELAVGKHEIKLTVWDAAGNSTEKLCTCNIKEKDFPTLA